MATRLQHHVEVRAYRWRGALLQYQVALVQCTIALLQRQLRSTFQWNYDHFFNEVVGIMSFAEVQKNVI